MDREPFGPDAKPPIIDHDPHERRPTNAIWWALWPFVGLQWASYFYFNAPDWWALAIGFVTGGVLASWAIEITGNKVPDSWRGKPSSPRRPQIGQDRAR
jgi:hypothetical protein